MRSSRRRCTCARCRGTTGCARPRSIRSSATGCCTARDVPRRRRETVYVGSARCRSADLAAGRRGSDRGGRGEASASLALQQRESRQAEGGGGGGQEEGETRERDPSSGSVRGATSSTRTSRAARRDAIERALALPPGEYDVYVGLIDRARVKTSSPGDPAATRHVPDFWNDQLALSSLILAQDVRPLKAAARGAAAGRASVRVRPAARSCRCRRPRSRPTRRCRSCFRVSQLRRARRRPDGRLHVLRARTARGAFQPDRSAAVRRRRPAAAPARGRSQAFAIADACRCTRSRRALRAGSRRCAIG